MAAVGVGTAVTAMAPLPRPRAAVAVLLLAFIAAPAAGLVCPPVPRPGCKAPRRDGAAKLSVTHGTGPSLRFTWRDGEATTVTELGAPTRTTTYALCIYDTSGAAPRLVFAADAPAGARCNGRPCWKATPDGFRYANAATGTAVLSRLMVTVDDEDQAEMIVKARAAAPLPSAPLQHDPLLTVMLFNDATAHSCWVADVPAPARRNDAKRFSGYARRGPRNRFGVTLDGSTILQDRTHDVVLQQAADAMGGWVRLQVPLDGTANVNAARYRDVLAQHQNVLLTMIYRDPANVQYATELSDPKYAHAGFPYVATPAGRQAFKNAVKALVASAGGPALAGRQVWFQCENEVGDRTVGSSDSWRGTAADYLAQLQAFGEAVKEVNAAAPVVLSGISSDVLETVIAQGNHPEKTYQSSRLGAQLASNAYDVVDLHFYDCVGTMMSKIGWLLAFDPTTRRPRLPPGRTWIASEIGGPDSAADPHQCIPAPVYDGACGTFECAQAGQLPERLSICGNAGGAMCLWSSLRDREDASPRFQHLGLIDQGPPNRYRKAFCTFRRTAAPKAPDYPACATSCPATCP